MKKVSLRRRKLGFKLFLRNSLGKINIGITSYSNLVRLQEIASLSDYSDLLFLSHFTEVESGKLLHLVSSSKSQLRQDLFVLAVLNFKKDGFFVEFGATDGIRLSNTHLLETKFDWKGILAEPAQFWGESLKMNRPNSAIETRCVWKDSDSILTLNEAKMAEYSTVDDYSKFDLHGKLRINGKKYHVTSISLEDMLIKHNAPTIIDYLSIDTEGSEYEILKDFNFGKYKFNVISCEHNFSINRELIYKLLTENGYVRVHQDLSQFDDWYVYGK